jgi:hypothetical protein
MLDTREAPTQIPKTEPARRSDTRSWLQDPVSSLWAYGLLAGWWGLFLLAQAFQPHAAAEHGMLAWIGAVLSVVFFGALLVAATGLVLRQRWGLVASLGAAGLLVADSIACPLTGHHQFGAFVVIQAVGSVALAGMSIRALRRS